MQTMLQLQNAEETQRKLRRVMLRTTTWLDIRGLALVMHKTELLLLIGRYIPLQVDKSIGNEVISKTFGNKTDIFSIQLRKPRISLDS